MKTVKEIMTAKAECVTKNENIKTAASKMEKSNIGFLPVVDENDKVIGTLTDRDITLAIGNTSKTPQEMKVNEVMNTTIHTIKAEDQAADALKLMRTKKVGRLPVVDKDNKIKGVITLSSIANKIEKSSEQAELEHSGSENILNTLRSLSQRSKKTELEEAEE